MAIAVDIDKVLRFNRDFFKRERPKFERALLRTGVEMGHDFIFEEPLPPKKWGVMIGSLTIQTTNLSIAGKAAPANVRAKAPTQGLQNLRVRVSLPVVYSGTLDEAPKSEAENWPSRARFDSRISSGFVTEKVFANESKWTKRLDKEIEREFS